MKKINSLLLSLFSGLLLWLAWQKHFTFVIFFAWVPLLLLSKRQLEIQKESGAKNRLFGLSYLTFFTWNVLTTFWIYFASFGGAAMAILSNSLLMALVYKLYVFCSNKINKTWTIWLLVPIWMSFEYLHMDWDLTWTWLTLGNVFAFQTSWIQWYEYSGVSGGSCWVLVINILIYQLLELGIAKRKLNYKKIALVFSLVLLPILVSQFIPVSSLLADKSIKTEVVIVQPNVDPYNEKFFVEPQIQLDNLLEQIKGYVDHNTKYLILPETFLTEDICEKQINNSFSINFLKESIIRQFPQLTIVTGASTYYDYGSNEKLSVTARKHLNSEVYFDYYNTGIQLDSSANIQVYHKSKLVPGVERMPFPALFKYLENVAINLGGTAGSLGTQEERTVFRHSSLNLKIAPVICYESVYGEYVTEYVRNGANFIFILTNDGWWSDTPGYKQHLAYASLRAIETRREIARCANTGISCVLDAQGNISETRPWWQKAIIKTNLMANNDITFYVRFGDILSKIALILSACAIALSIILRFKKH